MAKKKSPPARKTAEYRHDEKTPARPDVGTQPQFRKKAPPKTWRYDSSLSPALDWDAANPAREAGEALIADILKTRDLEAAKVAAAKLKALSRPFLNWSGKAERLSFDVPTLPLFVHDGAPPSPPKAATAPGSTGWRSTRARCAPCWTRSPGKPRQPEFS